MLFLHKQIRVGDALRIYIILKHLSSRSFSLAVVCRQDQFDWLSSAAKIVTLRNRTSKFVQLRLISRVSLFILINIVLFCSTLYIVTYYCMLSLTILQRICTKCAFTRSIVEFESVDSICLLTLCNRYCVDFILIILFCLYCILKFFRLAQIYKNVF